MWTDAEKTLLRLVLDELIPASADGRIPGAGSLELTELLAAATSYTPDPVGSINTILTSITTQTDDFAALGRAQRVAILHEINANQTEAFTTVLRLTYMGYYCRADIRPLFGVGKHPIHPDGYPLARESAALIQDLTEPVRTRGAIFRD